MRVAGRVVTGRRTPVPNAVIRAANGLSTRVDSAGRFELAVTTGAALEVSAPGLRPTTCVVHSGEGRRDLGDIELTGLATAAFVVTTAGGEPVRGASISWTPARSADEALNLRVYPPIPDAAWAGVGDTGEDGRVAANGLPSDRPLVVRALLEDGVPVVEGPVTLPAAGLRTIPIVVPVRRRLRVESLYRRGGAISPVRVSRIDGPPAGRWLREYENGDGFVELLLPAGVYEVGVRPEGRHLLRESVVMDRDREVRLDFERLDVIRLLVTDDGGRPVPAFQVTPAGAEPSPADVRWAFDMSPYIGRDGVAELAIPVKDPGAPQAGSFMVRAPGFALGRVTVPASDTTRERTATLRLDRGATVSGRITGIDEGMDVRLYHRRDPCGIEWTDDAPLLDSCRAGPGGTYRLRALGPGTYEVRVRSAAMDVPAGEVVVAAAGETRLDTAYAPATVEVTLAGEGAASPPVLIPLLQGSKWQGGADVRAREPVRGVRRGDVLVFEGVAPGRYLLDRADGPGHGWGSSLDAVPIRLEAGQQTSRRWSPTRATSATFHVVPPASGTDGLLLALVRASNPATFAAALEWRNVPPGGEMSAVIPGEEPFFVVTARLARSSEFVRVYGEVVPLAIRRCSSAAELDGARLVIPDGGTIVVQAEGVRSASVELVHEELSQFLREPRRSELGVPVADLLPGRWRITVTESVPPGRRGEESVVLTSGSTETIRVVVR